MLFSHIDPAYPSPSLCPQVHSLGLRLYSSPAPRFIRTIFFRFHTYVLAYSICFSLSDLLHSVDGPRVCHMIAFYFERQQGLQQPLTDKSRRKQNGLGG